MKVNDILIISRIRDPAALAEPQSPNTEHPSNATSNGTNSRPVNDVTSSTRQATQQTQAAAGSNSKVPKWFKGTGKDWNKSRYYCH